MTGYNFTTRVRHVLGSSREIAVDTRCEYVGTEHILLALMQDADGLAAKVVEQLGSSPHDIIDATLTMIRDRRPESARGPELPYTRRARRVIELAMQEARALGHTYIGTEHLLLGMIREGKDIGAAVLRDAGITIEGARTEVMRLLGREMPLGAGRARPRRMPTGAEMIRVDGPPVEIVLRREGEVTRRIFHDLPAAIEFLRRQGEEQG